MIFFRIFLFFFANLLTQKIIFGIFRTSLVDAVLAKLVIALACHAGDRGFEPRTSRTRSNHWAGLIFYRVVAQLVAHYVRDVGVAGSNPVYPTFKTLLFQAVSFFYAASLFRNVRYTKHIELMQLWRR